MDKYNISYITNKQIDTEKWDRGIRHAFNGNVFAYSWYLDVVSPGWDALVSDDYKILMPLPGATHMQQPSLEHPVYSGPLGIFSSEILSAGVVNSFLNRIPQKFKTIRLKLNKYNKLNGNLSHVYTGNFAYDMDLISAYEKIKEGYQPLLIQQLKKAEINSLSVVKGIRPNDLIHLYQQNKCNQPFLTKDLENRLRQLIAIIIRYNMGEIRAVYDQHNNLCAAGLFTHSHEKATLVFFADTHEGLEFNAFSYLLDRFIYEHSGKGLMLGLLNGVIDSREAIVKGFNFKQHQYPELIMNNLPWHLKIFSKL